MSMENVKKFYELAENDMEFAQKLASLDSEMALEASDLANLKAIVNEKILPLAKGKGLDFTAEEMVEFANEKYLQLSEDDLLEVSGGVSPKAAALGLSSVLMLSLGSAAAINLMNNNHDDVSHVVSDPSKTASEEKDESEDEEALKKSLDEMMKKSPKGADKNANMEDIEKELDKLFKGGKLGGGSAFRPGKGRTAGKNMLNRTIGKKGTSDFDFDKFLKELDDELARESATSQAAKPKATISETSNFDFDKFMEEINSDRKSEPGATRAAASDTTPLEEEAKPAPTATSARIKETTKPVPISRGTPKKIEKTKEEVETEKKLIQQKINTKLTDFKASFKKRFKEKYETQCNEKDLASFVKKYLYSTIPLDGSSINSETTVTFSLKVTSSGEVITKSEDILDFAKELNDALPKMQYNAVSRRDSWTNVMSHVMGALQEAKYDLNKFNLNAMKKLRDDIDWICGSVNKDGYLQAKFSANYGTDANSIERKNIEYLKALKDSIYNKNDEKVQSALKALGENIHEEPVKKPDASGTDQERIEREKKAEEERLMKEKEELKRQADKRAADFKEALIKDFKERTSTKVADEALRLYAEKYLEEHDKKDMDYVGMNAVFYAHGTDGNVEACSLDVFDILREINQTLPEKDAPTIFESQEAVQKIVDDLADTVKLTVEKTFNSKTQLSEAELQKFVDGITDELKLDEDLKKVAIVGRNSVTFFAKGQLKDGTKVDASETVNVLELAKELNAKLPKADVEDAKKDGTEKPQEELKENPVVKADAGATVTTAKDLQGQANTQKKEAEIELTDTFKAKIAANNGIELNEANLNKMISEALNSYKGQENITVNEKNGTITFTAKGITKGLILTGADSRSATLNVREFFTKLNNEAKTAHDAAMKQKIEEKKKAVEKESTAKMLGVSLSKKFKPITEDEMKQSYDYFVEELKQRIKAALEAKIRDIYSVQCKVARINFDSSKGVPTAVAAKIVNDLTEEQKKEIINSVMKNRLTTFQKPGEIKAHEQHGVLSWEPAALNEEVKVKVTADVKSFLWGDSATSKETIVNVREEVNSLIENYKLSYETVISRKADTEVDKLFEFLEKKELIKDGKIVDNVLDAIKDSDKEQFKKDVKHIAGQISGGEGNYSLSGKWRSYNVDQNNLKAIKDLATQLGV